MGPFISDLCPSVKICGLYLPDAALASVYSVNILSVGERCELLALADFFGDFGDTVDIERF